MSNNPPISVVSEGQSQSSCQTPSGELQASTVMVHQPHLRQLGRAVKPRLHHVGKGYMDAPRWVNVSPAIEALTSSMSMLSLYPRYFRLLDLPSEIRNCIYRFVVDQGAPPTPKELHDLDLRLLKPSCDDSRKKRLRCFEYRLLQPNITQASKQLRSESLPIFYSENIFCFDMDMKHTLIFNKWSLSTSASDMSHLNALCIALKARASPGGTIHGEHSRVERVNLYLMLSPDRTTFSIRSSSPLERFSQNALARAAMDVLGGKPKLSGLDLVVFASALCPSCEGWLHIAVLRDPKVKKDYPVECHGNAEPPRGELRELLTVDRFTNLFRYAIEHIDWVVQWSIICERNAGMSVALLERLWGVLIMHAHRRIRLNFDYLCSEEKSNAESS